MSLPFHQHLFPKVKQALGQYHMLLPNSRVAVGVSGGKDSLTALYALALLRRNLPLSYQIAAFSVDLGFPETNWSPVQDFCRSLDVEHHLIPTQIGTLLFEVRRESNPCALCSKLRHGALNNAARSAGFDTIALGHHRDDAIETLFLNMMFNGRIACFKPVTHLDRSGLRLIRPLLLVSEKTTQMVAAKLPLPVLTNPCPVNGKTKRQQIKEMLAQQTKLDRHIPVRLATALSQLWVE